MFGFLCGSGARVLREAADESTHAPMLIHRTLLIAGLAATLVSGIAEASAAEPLHAHLFTRAFSPDFVATADDSLPGERPRPVKIYFRTIEAGVVKIVSGKVVVADPFIGADQQPLALDITNGDYPVRLAVLQGTMGRGRVAFARLAVTERPVVRWETARPIDMHRDAENPDGDWGFTVDSGVAAFFDPAAGAAATNAAKANVDVFDRWLEQGQNAGAKERGATGAFRLQIGSGPGTVVAFDAGWGDGVYSVYAGMDADGRLAAILADFDIIDWSKVTE